MDWIAALNDRGIREMSIVGDSHQRFLAAHLHFLLMGQADPSVRRGQDDLVFHAFDGSSGTLRINFYWIDGIYKNGEFGCTLQGITTNQSKTFPNISTTADVTLFEGGYWAASVCRQPLKALRVHLAEFARWALAAAPVKGRVIFRTIPSFPVAGDQCNAWYPGPSSNRVAMAINVLLKHIVQGREVGGEGIGVEGAMAGKIGGRRSGGETGKLVYLDSSLQLLPRDSEDGEENGEGAGAENNGAAKGNGANSDFLGDNGATADGNRAAATVLDTWQVDASRYADTAAPSNHHYSMVRGTPEGAVVVGEVGEAQVRAFIHYLLHILPPPHASTL
ncbi:unnamed protein product [Closterium sp. Naga37s-1]|nr:unnamed protein product [Closterium sp. Naga37s-1]